jgi:hypothetical protein
LGRNSSTRPPLRDKWRRIALLTLLKRRTEQEFLYQASSNGKLGRRVNINSSTHSPLEEKFLGKLLILVLEAKESTLWRPKGSTLCWQKGVPVGEAKGVPFGGGQGCKYPLGSQRE